MLDRLGLVSQAEHEVGEAEVGVVLHHVQENGPVADRDHRLGRRPPTPRACADPARRRRSRPSQHFHPRDRDDDSARPTRACRTSWADDLVLEVPREDQDEVRTGVLERLRMLDRDVGAGQELALLVRVAIDREVEQVGADAAVVEQRVALARRAVAGDRACPPGALRSGTRAGSTSSPRPAARSRRVPRACRSRASRSSIGQVLHAGRSAPDRRRPRAGRRGAASRRGS